MYARVQWCLPGILPREWSVCTLICGLAIESNDLGKLSINRYNVKFSIIVIIIIIIIIIITIITYLLTYLQEKLF